MVRCSKSLVLGVLGLAVVCLLPATGGAQTRFAPVVQEVEPFSSAGSVLIGNVQGVSALPNSALLGHDYDYSVTGPLSVNVGGFVGFADSLFRLRAVPGLKYKFILPGLPFVPYAKAGLLAELLMGDNSRDHSLSLGVRAGGGVRHFFDERFGIGAEIGASVGWAAGGNTEGLFGLEALLAFEYLVP